MLKTVVFGTTGIVGQQFLVALQHHPWMKITALAVSERSVGRTYKDPITEEKTGASRWYCNEHDPSDLMTIPVKSRRYGPRQRGARLFSDGVRAGKIS